VDTDTLKTVLIRVIRAKKEVDAYFDTSTNYYRAFISF